MWAFSLPLWAYVLVGFCPPSVLLSYTLIGAVVCLHVALRVQLGVSAASKWPRYTPSYL